MLEMTIFAYYGPRRAKPLRPPMCAVKDMAFRQVRVLARRRGDLVEYYFHNTLAKSGFPCYKPSVG